MLNFPWSAAAHVAAYKHHRFKLITFASVLCHLPFTSEWHIHQNLPAHSFSGIQWKEHVTSLSQCDCPLVSPLGNMGGLLSPRAWLRLHISHYGSVPSLGLESAIRVTASCCLDLAHNSTRITNLLTLVQFFQLCKVILRVSQFLCSLHCSRHSYLCDCAAISFLNCQLSYKGLDDSAGQKGFRCTALQKRWRRFWYCCIRFQGSVF